MTGIRLITYYGLRGMSSEWVYRCDLLYLGACMAVAYICLPTLVRTASSSLACLLPPYLCTLFTNSKTSANAAGDT